MFKNDQAKLKLIDKVYEQEIMDIYKEHEQKSRTKNKLLEIIRRDFAPKKNWNGQGGQDKEKKRKIMT